MTDPKTLDRGHMTTRHPRHRPVVDGMSERHLSRKNEGRVGGTRGGMIDETNEIIDGMIGGMIGGTGMVIGREIGRGIWDERGRGGMMRGMIEVQGMLLLKKVSTSSSKYAYSRLTGIDGGRKRKSRWGAETMKVELPGLPSQITGNVSQTELDNYAIHVRLEEIGRKLRTGDVIPPPGQRSPSPPPEYDPYGRRTNTLDIRYRKKLEDERLRLIDRAMKADPTFKPPTDVYAGRGGRFGRPSDKVYIPVKEFPEINFFGLLVGPRGNTLKNMERETGAKISIRGKGSVKEGKQRPGDFPNDEDDELHCLVMADDEAKVRGCVALINRVIETVSLSPYSTLHNILIDRLPRLPKVRTTISETSFESLPRLTVHSEMTRTSFARTVVKKVSLLPLPFSYMISLTSRSSPMGMPTTTSLLCQCHLPSLWWRRSHGSRLSRSRRPQYDGQQKYCL